MINQNLLYGLILFILAYMRINPGKNILCYIILFLIALIVLYPVEGWSIADAATTGSATIGTDTFYDFEVVVQSPGGRIDEAESLSLSAGQSVKFKFKYNVGANEYAKIADYGNLPGNILNYRNIINLLVNDDYNQSNLRYKLSAYNGTTNEGTTVEQATTAVTAGEGSFDIIDGIDISIFDMNENITCEINGNDCNYSNIDLTDGPITLQFSVDLTNKINTVLIGHQAKIFKLEYAPTCVIAPPTQAACAPGPEAVELTGTQGDASGCTVTSGDVILPILTSNVVENYYNGWTITMGANTATVGDISAAATGTVNGSSDFNTSPPPADGPRLTVVWEDTTGPPSDSDSPLEFTLSPFDCSAQASTSGECGDIYPSCRITDADPGGLATCGGDDETIKGAIRNAYNNTTTAGILNCSDYDVQTALTAAGNSTCDYNPLYVKLFKITKTTGSTTTNSATPCTVTGTVASGGTCDDSCTADKRCSGDLVCSGDSTDSDRKCVEPPNWALWIALGVSVLAVICGLAYMATRSNSGGQPSSSEVDPLVS